MTKDKVRGTMLGVAIGDQLGMPVETYTSEKILKCHGYITNYIDPNSNHKWFGGMKSRWTDDTQLTLAVAESLIAKKRIDMDDMAARHVSALKEGDLGWGRSTRESVKRLETGVHWSLSGEPGGIGNGVAMKIAPLAIYSWLTASFYETLAKIPKIASMTHLSKIAGESALAQFTAVSMTLEYAPLRFYRDSFILQIVLQIGKKHELLGDITPLKGRLETFRHLKIERLPVEEKIKLFGGANSEVQNSLPFCYSMFLANPTGIETLYDTINAGGDTDTNGSIVCALLGALNGTKIFPKHLIDGLWQKEKILDTANRLCDAFEIKD